MMGWLKKRLRKWLLDSESEPMSGASPTIQALVDGKIELLSIQEVVGMGLRCLILGKRKAEMRLITSEQAVNPTEFWRLWKQLGGQANWGDGTKFEPTAERH